MDYAQSRLQSRFGERPDELLWRKLEAMPEPAAALAIARSSGLRRWVVGITAHADTHEIEIALRARWRECVIETASWMPNRWQAAMLWTRGLVDLPALCHLAHGGAPLPWMFADPVLQAHAGADAVTRESLLREHCRVLIEVSPEFPGRAVSPARLGPARIHQAWLEEWRRRWPGWSETAALEYLARLFDAAMNQPAAIGRPELLGKLGTLFRRSALSPVAAFVYVAFAALDIQRLRAGLLKHALAREGIVPS